MINFLYDRLIDDKPIKKINKQEKKEYLKNYTIISLILVLMFLMPFVILALL